MAENRENAEVLQSMIRSINSNRVYQSWPQSLELVNELLENVTSDALTRFYRQRWERGGLFVSVSGKCDSPDIEAGRKRIEEIYRSGLKKEIASPAATAKVHFPYLPGPSVSREPIAQQQKKIPGTDLTLYEASYANGLLLRMLPTDYVKKRISLSFHVGQGYDGVPDEKYHMAKLGFLADSSSGFGKLSAHDAQHLARTHGIRVQSALRRYSTVISGSGETDELEHIVAAMWAQYKDATFEKQHLAEALKSLELADQHRGKDAPSLAKLESYPFFYGETLRSRPTTRADVAGIQLAELAAYHKSLHQGGQPVLNVVGDFDPKKIIKSMGHFFGADAVSYPDTLSSSHTPKSIFPEKGLRHRILTAPSTLNQAELKISWLRPLEQLEDRRTLLLRRLTSAVVKDRLRDRIREDKGLAYSPSMTYRVDNVEGYGLYRLNVSSQPAQMKALKHNIREVIAGFADRKVTAQELSRQKKTLLSSWKRAQKENRAFSSRLELMARQPGDYFAWFAKWQQWIEEISAEEINKEIAEALVDEKMAVLEVTEEIPAPEREKDNG